MHVTRTDNGDFIVELALDEGNRLASAIVQHAEELPSAALDLASLLRQARYRANDDFRQPPDPWEPGATFEDET